MARKLGGHNEMVSKINGKLFAEMIIQGHKIYLIIQI